MGQVLHRTAPDFGIFDERKIEAFGGVWLATPWLLIITPQKQAGWKKEAFEFEGRKYYNRKSEVGRLL